MNMRFENVRNGKIRGARHFDINLHIGSRINTAAIPSVIVSQQIRKFCDASV